MLFNSSEFIFYFFPLVTVLYFIFPHKFRWIILLVSSCYFYMAFIPKYILILFLLIIIDYLAGLAIERYNKKRKQILILSLASNLGMLIFFKYFNFLNANLNSLMSVLGWNYSAHALSIALPIGLSFHTFQSMSYVIEVYRGRQKPEKHLGIYALYVLFFPQLVAGPIERPYNLIHQFRKNHNLDYDRIFQGLQLMLLGFFKKLFVADRLALYVNDVFSSTSLNVGDSFRYLFGMYFFAIQIYCDFSGYSDIARGAAKILGINLMKNFDQPYFSSSIGEFWRRWHISLSSWFKDYVYLPLGGNRVSKTKWIINILIVFLLSGLWHGASWLFIFWGFLHALFIIFSDLMPAVEESKFIVFVKTIVIFHLVSFAFIFFRSTTFSDALNVVTGIFAFNFNIKSLVFLFITNPKLSSCVLAISLLFIFELFFESKTIEVALPKTNNVKFYTRHALCVFGFILLLTGAVFSKNTFIYFQF